MPEGDGDASIESQDSYDDSDGGDEDSGDPDGDGPNDHMDDEPAGIHEVNELGKKKYLKTTSMIQNVNQKWQAHMSNQKR